MIHVEHLCKYYGPVRAVDDVSFAVAGGEIVGVLGPNGAGKSTTLRILTSYLSATSGTASVAGFDVMTQADDVRRNIGYLPQAVPIYPEMRVEEYLAYRGKLKGIDRKLRNKRIDHSLERCRCREVRRRLVGTLSNGYRQRVGLADALLHDPPILILDEPTAGLDPLQIRETLATIRGLGGQHTVLFSTHILSEVEAVCQRVLIINHGRIELDEPLAAIREEAATVFVEVAGPGADVLGALKAVDGVAEVVAHPASGGHGAYTLHCAGGADPREAVYRAIARHPAWSLRRLERRQRTLEDRFVEVVLRRDSAAAA